MFQHWWAGAAALNMLVDGDVLHMCLSPGTTTPPSGQKQKKQPGQQNNARTYRNLTLAFNNHHKV